MGKYVIKENVIEFTIERCFSGTGEQKDYVAELRCGWNQGINCYAGVSGYNGEAFDYQSNDVAEEKQVKEVLGDEVFEGIVSKFALSVSEDASMALLDFLGREVQVL